jgi:stage II sporulation protein AB (anti-sigma F factor)
LRPQNELRLEIPGRSINEGFARVAVAAFVSQLDPTLDELADIKTAVSEAVTNCIVHAYEGTVGSVYINVKIFDAGRVRICVKDKGCGIDDVAKAMEPMYSGCRSSDRAGLGFTVMQTFMDKLRVRSRPGHGTAVIMEKIISSK